MRIPRWPRAALVLALAGYLVARPASGHAATLSFADGHWTGDATLLGGAEYNGALSYDITGGGCGFELTIAGGRVASGTISCSGTTEGTVRITGRTLHVTTQEHADGPLSGPADSVTGALATTFSGTVEGYGSAGPFSEAGSVSVKPDTVDCGVASGDLAARWRAVQQAFGMQSTEQAVFYAVRDSTGAGARAAKGVSPSASAYTKLMNDLAALAAQDPRKLGPDAYILELQRLAAAEAAYLSTVLKAASCPAGGKPSPAWKQDALARAFQKAIEHAFIGPTGATYTLAQWGELLDLGLQTNAVIPPRSGPGSEDALWDAIEGQLAQQLRAAVADGDQDAIFHVYVLASGAGMTDLANQARGAMKK